MNFSVCYDQFLLHLARRGTTTDPLLQGPYFFLKTVGSCSMPEAQWSESLSALTHALCYVIIHFVLPNHSLIVMFAPTA